MGCAHGVRLCFDLYTAQAKQKERILMLAEDPRVGMHYLIWVTVTQRIMIIHKSLFKRGVFYRHDDPNATDADRRVACFEFCRGVSGNPLASLLSSLGAMMFDPDGVGFEYLTLLHTRYGVSVAEWPSDLVEELHQAVVVSFARLWRLIFWYFQQYPWRLAPVFDPESSETTRDEAIDEFLRIPMGSKRLDPGLGRKVREIVDSREDVLAQPLHDTLLHTFLRVVVTSTFVERVFKELTAWCNQHGQSTATIAAKYTNEAFDNYAARWRTEAGHQPCSQSGIMWACFHGASQFWPYPYSCFTYLSLFAQFEMFSYFYMYSVFPFFSSNWVLSSMARLSAH